MNLIHNNPFRVLGLPVTAREREIAKRISDLAIHAEMGSTPSYPSDFPVLSEIRRDGLTIKDASNHIEQPDSKLYYAQFWFWDQNETDSEAFQYLRENELSQAVNLWTKTFEGGKVTKKNYSNMRNLSVLLLGRAVKNGQINKDYFTKGIILAGKTFDSDYFYGFAEAVVGEFQTVDRDAVIKSWVEEVLQSFRFAIDKEDSISSKEVVECFKYFPSGMKDFVTDKFITQPLQSIENDIASAGEKRNASAERAKLYGIDLHNSVKDDLEFMRLMLGERSLRYQNSADKVANEILQCAVDFFNESIENNTELKASEDAMKLAEMAMSIAEGVRVKARIEENIELISKWESEQTNKERISEVQEEVDTVLDYVRDLPFIKGLSYYERIRLPGIAEEFVANAFQKLEIIRSVLGKDDSYYMQLSTLVANNAIGMCVLYVNTTDDPRAVTTTMDQIDQLDMGPELRERFETNRNKLERIMMRRGLVQ
jgi:hypothetical protein